MSTRLRITSFPDRFYQHHPHFPLFRGRFLMWKTCCGKSGVGGVIHIFTVIHNLACLIPGTRMAEIYRQFVHFIPLILCDILIFQLIRKWLFLRFTCCASHGARRKELPRRPALDCSCRACHGCGCRTDYARGFPTTERSLPAESVSDSGIQTGGMKRVHHLQRQRFRLDHGVESVHR